MLRMVTGLAFLLCLIATPAAYAERIKEADIRGHISILASDEFEGRAPGTIGEEKTRDYIKAQWIEAGLQPAAISDSGKPDWFQHVPLQVFAPVSHKVTFRKGRRRLRFSNSDIMLVGSDSDFSRNNVPITFVGTGLKGDGSIVSDVEGKAVLMLVEPAADTPDALIPIDARMQMMADAGAEAVILVVKVGGWRAAQRQFSKPVTILDGSSNRAPVQAIVSTQYAVGLVASSGGDWDKLLDSAYSPEFKGKPLGVQGDFEVTSRIDRFKSHNIIGKIPGKRPGAGAVMFMGHWDHFGFCGANGDADRICNGAVDNASGIAVLIEIARELARKEHDRDIYFLATTAEESGLLGAYHFVDNPVLPLTDLVMVLNLDTTAVAPRGTKVAIIGPNNKIIKPIAKKLLRKQRRKLNTSGDADIFEQRQDGWAFVQRGVPAFVVGSAFGDMDRLNGFLSGNYHGAGDELTDKTQLGGATQDADLHVSLGRHFANARKYKLPKRKAAEAAGE